MASLDHAVLCALLSAAYCSLLGYATGRYLLPGALALGVAPVLGWAVFSVLALPIFNLIGFSPAKVAGVAIAGAVLGAAVLVVGKNVGETRAGISWWGLAALAALAALLAMGPAAAILPKTAAGSAYLADPIFDHSKIAIVDAMMRQGLPPVNPVFGETGSTIPFAYYYLWHFSAAALALPLHLRGWDADLGLTWFTAFASLCLLMGVAAWLSGRAVAALWVVLLAAAASLRVTLGWLFGPDGLQPFLLPPTGFSGWLFQSAWVPQHLMSASCVVLAMMLIAAYVERQTIVMLLGLVVVVVAGFESSTYVGGVTFAVAAAVAAPVLLARVEPGRRVRTFGGLALAAVVVAACAIPFIRDQLANVAARGDHHPIVVRPFEVVGALFSPVIGRILDLPAYWLILLPLELPASYLAGIVAFAALRKTSLPAERRLAVALLACLAGAGLVVSWLLVSTLGDNNDLGLRAVLPPVMILIAIAAAGIVLPTRRALIGSLAVTGLLLSLPDSVKMIHSYVVGTTAPDAAVFAQTPALWRAVRRYARPGDRVANNPLFLADLTPWPANISWALLADRSSCFAGREMALAFAPLSSSRRGTIDTMFIRVFAGQGTSADIDTMATQYDCAVVVLVPQDKAWTNDPFAGNAHYRLAENRDGAWRIYTRVNPSP